MEKFVIGEIAILQNTTKAGLDGLEVTIIGEFKRRRYTHPNRQGQMEGDCWYISNPGNYSLNAAEADQLKKKRPPQDWVKLCKLDQAPNSVVKGLEKLGIVTY